MGSVSLRLEGLKYQHFLDLSKPPSINPGLAFARERDPGVLGANGKMFRLVQLAPQDSRISQLAHNLATRWRSFDCLKESLVGVSGLGGHLDREAIRRPARSHIATRQQEVPMVWLLAQSRGGGMASPRHHSCRRRRDGDGHRPRPGDAVLGSAAREPSSSVKWDAPVTNGQTAGKLLDSPLKHIRSTAPTSLADRIHSLQKA